jgi:SAM-dependent methyltransferase
MTRERYAPGYSDSAVALMARPSLSSHGQFLEPCLDEARSVLDRGCELGTNTLGIAERVGSGAVVGVDLAESHTEQAAANAARCAERFEGGRTELLLDGGVRCGQDVLRALAPPRR